MQSLEPRLTWSDLPDAPLVSIEPNQSWRPLRLRDLWVYRELLYFLTWRDLKVRYKQTFLGLAWIIIQPLMITLIYTIFLGQLVRVPSEGLPYLLFVYSGLIPWTFFSSAITSSGSSLVSNAHLITKVYFPRMVIPVATIGARIPDFGVGLLILAGIMFYYRVSLTWHILLLPVFIVLTVLLALSCGMLMAALSVKYRDIGFALPALMQFWMFASPVVYPMSLVPPRWHWVYKLNPLVGIIESFRASLFGRAFNWPGLAVSAAVTLLLLICSAYVFRRSEKNFADLI